MHQPLPGLRVVVAALLAAAGIGGRPGLAGERIERFLPPPTFVYGGVERLEEGFDKIMAGLHRALPDVEALDQERFLRELTRELRLGDGGTREEFLAATGLDPARSAGIAWVLCDPSSGPGRSVNENVLLILPVRDVGAAERVLSERILPEFAEHSERRCRALVRRVQELKQRWRRLHQDVGARDVTWEDLAEVAPGLRPLDCPCGGRYVLGKPDDPPVCTVHTEHGGRERFEGPFTRAGLGTRAVGDVTLVGGRRVGTGYAVAGGHLVLSNSMNVLEASVAAAAGKGPRAEMAPPGPQAAKADGRAYIQWRLLLDVLRHELERAVRRRGPSPAAERLFTLFAGGGATTADVRLGEDVSARLSWAIRRNPQTARVLDKRPAALEALALVPDTALAAWGANLARESFSVIGDIALLEEPQLAGAAKLVMAAADGDGAFAFTPGAFEGEVPNMLFVLRVRDREVMDAAVESWLGIFTRGHRGDDARGLQRQQVGGVEVRSLAGRRGQSFHYAYVGPFVVFGTDLAAVRGVIAVHGGRREASLVASERYRRLGLPGGAANAVSFVDMPAFVRQIWGGGHERRLHWRNQACLRNMQQIERLADRFRRDAGRAPANFEELGQPRGDRRRRERIRPWCMMFGEEVRLTIDRETGRVACPRHGTVEQFRPIGPDEPREVREEERVLSAFGTWGLRLHVEGDRILAEGRLIPAPQRRPKPRPRPQPRPVGPAEF